MKITTLIMKKLYDIEKEYKDLEITHAVKAVRNPNNQELQKEAIRSSEDVLAIEDIVKKVFDFIKTLSAKDKSDIQVDEHGNIC